MGGGGVNKKKKGEKSYNFPEQNSDCSPWISTGNTSTAGENMLS